MLSLYLSVLETQSEKTKFSDLYSLYKNLMFHIAHTILQNREDAEDAVHTAFISILKHLDTVEQIESNKTKNWVALIVKNQALNLYKRRKRDSGTVIDLDEFYTVPSEEQPLETEMDVYYLKELIALLPDKYRDILQLVILYGQDYKAIATLLSITQENARKRFQRAKDRLKELMRERGEFVDDL